MNDIDSIEEFKAVTIGLDGVGKTSLINCYSGHEFEDNIYSTIASTCFLKTIKFENLDYSIRIWDTPGREAFIRLLRIFLKNAHIIILVFDMTKKESFLYLDKLLELVELEMDFNEVMFVLIGNKADLFENWEIKESDAKKFADILQAKFFLSSAKKNPELFREFLDKVFEDYIRIHKENSGINNERLGVPNPGRQRIINLNNRRNRRHGRGCIF